MQLFNAARTGNLARARELHGLVMRVSESLYRVGRHCSAIIKGIKGALSLYGVCDDFMAEPFHRFRGPEREQARRILVEFVALDSDLFAAPKSR